MGSSNSRLATFRNEEPIVIEVTDDVIRRLHPGVPKTTATVAYIEKPSQSCPQVSAQPDMTMDMAQENGNVNTAIGNPTKISDSSVEANNNTGQKIRGIASIIEEMDEERKKKLWLKEFERLSKVKRLELLEEKYFGISKNQESKENKSYTCGDLSKQIVTCYKAHPGQADIKCSDLVQEYDKCIKKYLKFTSYEL